MAEQKVKEAGTHEGAPPPYTVWRIETTIYDQSMQIVDKFEDTQELWINPPNMAVRRTRQLPNGDKIVYEDRGQLNEKFQISGKDGFGGKLSGQLLPTGWVYTQGTGGAAEFRMTNTPLGQGHQCCLRVIDVREPVAFLTPETLKPGRYYVTTDDKLISASDGVPESMKRPLA